LDVSKDVGDALHCSVLNEDGSKSRITIMPMAASWKDVVASWKETRRRDGMRGLVGRLLETPLFDGGISVVVAVNSITIGIEQGYRLRGESVEVFQHLETGFLAVYLLELCLRFYSKRCKCLDSNWVRFDCLLVLVGVFSHWVIGPLAEKWQSSQISTLLVLRVARLLRLARTMRLVVKFRDLWMLAQGLLNSLNTLVHTLALGLVLLYIVGCVAMELIPLAMTANGEALDDSTRALISDSFRSLPVTMLTLVQFITFDNVVYIYKPLIEADASLALFFMAAILLLGVVFMNLVTAIIVNGGLEQAMQDNDLKKATEEAKRKQMLISLECAFHRVDTNNSGAISRKELEAIDAEDKCLLQEILGLDDLLNVFDYLDVEGTGEIGISEFCHGIEGIVLSETPLAVKRTERMIESMRKQLRDCLSMQERLTGSVGTILSALNLPSEETDPQTPSEQMSLQGVDPDGRCTDMSRGMPGASAGPTSPRRGAGVRAAGRPAQKARGAQARKPVHEGVTEWETLGCRSRWCLRLESCRFTPPSHSAPLPSPAFGPWADHDEPLSVQQPAGDASTPTSPRPSQDVG